VAGDEFAELLRELKERSGLSYGVLGKRVHVSASTLHRYVNGDAVPTDYAPVERLARLSKATPEELVELHRRWVRADALRGRKGAESPVGGAAGATADAVSVAGSGLGPELASEAEAVRRNGRRRTGVLAGAAMAAAVVSGALVVNLVPREGGEPGRSDSVAGAPEHTRTATGTPDAKRPSPSASTSREAGSSASASATATATEPASGTRSAATATGATAPAVAVNPYKFEDPCSQHYLLNRNPAQVPPPPNEQDARQWVTALGGVAGKDQMLTLTVQGTGKATVVLEALHVRVVQKGAPLAWSDYAMGVGCGGGVSTKSFDVDLDAGRPDVTPKDGQRDFPYKVSESDPEVFYVTAHARAHEVSWFLELEWSSGNRHGTVRIDDRGKLLRTSGNAGRPAYDYPLGGSEWETAPDG
jgi:hypothetical protein